LKSQSRHSLGIYIILEILFVNFKHDLGACCMMNDDHGPNEDATSLEIKEQDNPPPIIFLSDDDSSECDSMDSDDQSA